MVTLALTGAPGATEGALLSCWAAAGEPLVQLDVTARRDLPELLAQAPSRGVTTTLAIGREAGAVAAGLLDQGGWTSVLLRGELDVSPRYPAQLEAFRTIAASAGRLVLEDPWEMGKAATYGSRVPHLQLPPLGPSGAPVLVGRTPRVAVLHAGAELAEALAPGLRAVCDRRGATYELVPVAGLYTAQHLQKGRTLADVLRERLGSFTHVVVTGDHRDTSAVLGTLAAQPDRVVVEGTLSSTALVHRLPGVALARGTALVDRLDRALETWEPGPAPEPEAATRRLLRRAGARFGRGRDDAAEAVAPSPVPAWFTGLAARDLPWYHEELWDGSLPPGDLDVYVTVAPVENRANGARPQRVRNMAEAFVQAGPTIVLRPDTPLLDRRIPFLERLLADGWRPRTVYGESSTSPMATVDMIDRVAGVLDRLGAAGARRAWFVRDLHWLSEEVPGGPASSELVERGLHELRALAEVTEVFLGPNDGSAAEWESLLSPHGVTHRRWAGLPPALHPDNVCDIGRLAEQEQGLTMLYAGGIGGFYKQDVFMAAVAELSSDDGLRLDLVVPATEVDALRSQLEQAGVSSDAAVRVIVQDLSWYLPVTRDVVGVVLFDGKYAAHAFPFKTVSMLERGLHVLCFDEMAVADFLRPYDAGLLCDRDAGSVVDAVRAYRQRHDRIPVAALLEDESWGARVRQVRDLLKTS